MEQQNQQPNQGFNQTLLAEAKRKKSKRIKVYILALVAVVLAVGGILLLKTTGPEPAPSPVPAVQENLPPAPSPQVLDTSTWQTYRSEEFGFEVRYPDLFIVREQSGRKDDFYLTKFFLEDPLKPISFFNGVSIQVKTAGRIEVELEYQKWRIVGHVADSIIRETKIEGDGYQGVKFEYEVSTSEENLPLTTVILTNRKHSYIITSSSDLTDQILSTFRFVE